MYKILIVLLITLLNSAGLYAQHVQVFTLYDPNIQVNNSLYNKLKVLDSRADTSQLGIVQTGAFNRKAKVVVDKPLAPAIVLIFGKLAAQATGKGTLLLQLRQFNFAEVTSAMSEKGYCYLRAGLYSNQGDRYQMISFIDTLVAINGIDVTRSLMYKGSELLTDFLMQNMLKGPTDSTAYTFQNLVKIDELEKGKLKLYTTDAYADGVYLTYRSFANQTPDKAVVVQGNVTSAGTVKALNEKGKLQQVKPQKVYAVVYKGQPFITSRNDFYPLTKTAGDFIFTGKAATSSNSGEVMMASMFFGMLGTLMASNAEATFEMKIDHVNGGFIKLREIPITTPAYVDTNF